MPFRALNLSPQMLQAVHDAGYTEPTPIQIADHDYDNFFVLVLEEKPRLIRLHFR